MAMDIQGQTQSFGDYEKRIFDFVGTLADIGVNIKEKSPLEGACYDAIRVHMLHVDPASRNLREDVRLAFRPLLGLWTLVDKTLRLKTKKGFAAFRAHYQMLNDGVAWQNDKYAVGDQAADKIFELVFGLSVLAIGEDLDVDDPIHSAGGTNPDILATIGGERWSVRPNRLPRLQGELKGLVQNLGTPRVVVRPICCRHKGTPAAVSEVEL